MMSKTLSFESGGANNSQEIFTYMMIEEFLMKKNLTKTLESFRNEWSRPNDVTSILSWYDVALRLHIPEISEQNSTPSSTTVAENLVKQVIRDASVRTRKDTDVIVSGLATVPRTSSLPLITTSMVETSDSRLEKSRLKDRENEKERLSLLKLLRNGSDASSTPIMKKSSDPLIPERYNPNNNSSNNKLRSSNENWIPEVVRMRSIHRDLSVMKENMEDIRVRELTQSKELKRCSVTDLQRAHVEETLGSTKKIACACCQQKYLYVNLPLKVSQKAIVDIRIKWSGGLNSVTIFEGTSTSLSTEIEKSSSSLRLSGGKMDDRMKAIPRCYDEVRVCIFCAQFFQDQDAYRPSFDQICYEERKVEHFENRRREKEYWDPLKMVEKYREEEEKKEEDERIFQETQRKSLEAQGNVANIDDNNGGVLDDNVES